VLPGRCRSEAGADRPPADACACPPTRVTAVDARSASASQSEAIGDRSKQQRRACRLPWTGIFARIVSLSEASQSGMADCEHSRSQGLQNFRDVRRAESAEPERVVPHYAKAFGDFDLVATPQRLGSIERDNLPVKAG
jgi:hypothetical protein